MACQYCQSEGLRASDVCPSGWRIVTNAPDQWDAVGPTRCPVCSFGFDTRDGSYSLDMGGDHIEGEYCSRLCAAEYRAEVAAIECNPPRPLPNTEAAPGPFTMPGGITHR